MTDFYAQTMPGVAEIAWLEIRDRLAGAKFQQYLFAKEQNGIVAFTYTGSPGDLLTLRTAEDVFMLALHRPHLSRTRHDLAEIRQLVEQSEEFGRVVNHFLRFLQFHQPPTYRVISRKYGEHPYRRKDMEQVVLQGLDRRYPRWTLVPDGGQVEVWVNLLGSDLLIGLRLSDRNMRHRHTKRVDLPASLRPSVAAAMVYLSQPKPDEVVVDPMCGSGTILLERQAVGACHLVGGDILADRVRATAQNVAPGRQAVSPRPLLLHWSADRLPFANETVDKIVTNLPFGQQIQANLPRLYPAFFAEVARVLRRDGRVIVLSAEFDLVKESVRRQPSLQILTGYSIAVLGRWGRIYIIEKTKS